MASWETVDDDKEPWDEVKDHAQAEARRSLEEMRASFTIFRNWAPLGWSVGPEERGEINTLSGALNRVEKMFSERNGER